MAANVMRVPASIQSDREPAATRPQDRGRYDFAPRFREQVTSRRVDESPNLGLLPLGQCIDLRPQLIQPLVKRRPDCGVLVLETGDFQAIAAEGVEPG